MRALNFASLITRLVFFGGLFCSRGYAQSGGPRLEEIPPQTNIEQSPLWELGMGAGATDTPDYPGSDQNHIWAIPFPFGIYRGEILHSDRRGGTRARFFRSVSYELNISAGGGLPSSSSRNDARAGMPDLEWLGEVGPRIMIDVLSFRENRLLRLGLPLRASFSANGEHLRDHGYLFAPELLLDYPHFLSPKLDAFTLLTVNFSDRRFADYFYEVRPEFATVNRPAYATQGGYFLTDLTAGMTVQMLEDWRISLSSSLQFLKGARNEASPLFRTPFTSSVSIVVIWVFARSSQKVVPED